jgi:ADP-heptose:LPS heptosyltransferase
MRFDWVIDLQGLARTGLMTAFSGAPVRIGFADAREGSRHTYTHRVRVAAGLHAVERNLALLQKIGIPVASARPHLPIDPVERTLAQEQLHPYPRPWIAVAPGAKWETKRWPPEHFAALLARWFTARGTGTAFVIGAAEDHPLAERIAQRLPQTVNLTGQTPLPRLTAILSLADLMLANDTGPLHLAAALGRPCVAPYTCTSVRRHAPYAVPGGGVETAVPCGGSYLKKCPNAYRCFEELTPDRLWPLLDQTLVWPSHSRSA